MILLCAGCRNEAPPPAGEVITRVRSVRVVPEEISIPVRSGGVLMTTEEMKLSFKTGGIVEKIVVREGDKVRGGDLIALLNLSEIRANVSLAENGFEKSLRDLTRIKNLYADTVVTLEQLQNATSAFEAARTTLEIARFNFLHSAIRAPADGIILKQLVRENEIVSPGYPVLLFGSSGGSWKVKTGISDRDIIKINRGDSATVTTDAYPGVVFKAVVEQISGVANPMTGTYEVELFLNGAGYRLAAGFIAAVDIYPAVRRSVILVPAGAVVEADGDTGYIFAVNGSDIAEKFSIKITAITGPNMAVTGIPAGITEVVYEGAAYLKHGTKVEVVK
jgi:RND family efflux transporter MFP subunit